MNSMKIALDGPSGAGKSSLARAIADKLQIVYVDTGALYRSIGLFMRSRDIDPKDAQAVEACLPEVDLRLAHENGEQHIYLCGKDVGDSIRTPEMSMYASAVSAIPAVRAFLLDTQRSIAQKTSVIMDGRDIGTVILPDAEVKIFLTASVEARARRRVLELAEKGIAATYEEVLADMIERDKNDSTRKTAPAIPAEDAVFLDNSDLTFAETVERALAIVVEKTTKIRR
ncbi:MAG: (d)CMP kinase [Clostridia bacterium]|nr:(d)CMP kinase [Clostridia bacterium]MBQ8859644.1 (d)CMP kinase [Clostridia bacterium]